MVRHSYRRRGGQKGEVAGGGGEFCCGSGSESVPVPFGLDPRPVPLPVQFGCGDKSKWISQTLGIYHNQDLPLNNVYNDIMNAITDMRGRQTRKLVKVGKDGSILPNIITIIVRGHTFKVVNDRRSCLFAERNLDTITWLVSELHKDLLQPICNEDMVAGVSDSGDDDDDDTVEDYTKMIAAAKVCCTDDCKSITWTPSHNAFRVRGPAPAKQIKFFTIRYKKRKHAPDLLAELMYQKKRAIAFALSGESTPPDEVEE